METSAWRHIADELRSVALRLPLAVWNMRREISSVLTATDATPSSAGVGETYIPQKLASELFRRADYRGECVRLDQTQPPGSRLDRIHQSRCTEEKNELGASLQWLATGSYYFRQTSHVNLQELRAIRNVMRKRALDVTQHGKIHLVLTDSQVYLGAVGKGRSSTYKINGVLRGMLPWLVVSNTNAVLALNYAHTKSNPADRPSRFVAFPPVPPAWLQRYTARPGFRSGGKFLRGVRN